MAKNWDLWSWDKWVGVLFVEVSGPQSHLAHQMDTPWLMHKSTVCWIVEINYIEQNIPFREIDAP